MGILYQQFTTNLLPRQVRRVAKLLRVKTKVRIDEAAVQRCRSWSMTGMGRARPEGRPRFATLHRRLPAQSRHP